ncbi:MAG: DUF3343 domain-containing protein [Planctomycetaceae bacterium]|nr:DUF3343 domain-containing protein [Planctomycetaceae bacterium]
MILVTCHSISSALLLERALKTRGVGCTVVPVPRDLSSSCGYAVETAWTEDAPNLTALMDDRGVEWETIFDAADGYRALLTEPG